jgi:hypothetical protein
MQCRTLRPASGVLTVCIALIQVRRVIDVESPAMQITVTIDDALYEKALEMAEPGTDKADVIREALKTFVRVQVAKRLADLGGKVPEIQDVPRRREGATSP